MLRILQLFLILVAVEGNSRRELEAAVTIQELQVYLHRRLGRLPSARDNSSIGRSYNPSIVSDENTADVNDLGGYAPERPVYKDLKGDEDTEAVDVEDTDTPSSPSPLVPNKQPRSRFGNGAIYMDHNGKVFEDASIEIPL
jgi:hypothetical protein